MSQFPYSDEWKSMKVGDTFPSMKALFGQFGIVSKRYETYRKRVENYVEFRNLPGSRKVVVEKIYLDGKIEVFPSKRSIDTMKSILAEKVSEEKEEELLMSKSSLALTLGLSSRSLNTFLFDGKGIVLEEGISDSDVDKFYERYYKPILDKYLGKLPIERVYVTRVLSEDSVDEIRITQDSIERIKRHSFTLKILKGQKEEIFEKVKKRTLSKLGANTTYEIVKRGEWNLFVQTVNSILVPEHSFLYPTKEYLVRASELVDEQKPIHKKDLATLKNEFKRAILEDRKIKEPLSEETLKKICEWV